MLDIGVRCADEVVTAVREAGDLMSACEALVVRAEANLRRRDLGEALGDNGMALALAEKNGYRYVVAAAHRQRAKVLAALGRKTEAESSELLAAGEFAKLTSTFRDPTVELIVGSPIEMSSSAADSTRGADGGGGSG